MQTAPIESDELRAESLLSELCPELQKITDGGRSQERIKMLRQVIERLLLNAIPTAVIAKTLKMEQPVIQYHARWLEKQGKIIRPSKHSHWIWARENGEN
jgi:DNA-binding transcriptional ArsR family regulator